MESKSISFFSSGTPWLKYPWPCLLPHQAWGGATSGLLHAAVGPEREGVPQVKKQQVSSPPETHRRVSKLGGETSSLGTFKSFVAPHCQRPCGYKGHFGSGKEIPNNGQIYQKVPPSQRHPHTPVDSKSLPQSTARHCKPPSHCGRIRTYFL